MSAPMFSVKDLWAGYGEQQVLRGIHLDLHPGTITALIGANGAGKTTFLRTVSGLVKTSRGSAVLEGCSLTGLPPHRIVDQGFVQSPEGKQLFPEMTVMENLMVGASTPRARARRSKTMDEIFALFPILDERRHQLAGTLSGGQQQMVAVGRALMALPRVLALDEPSLGLAPIMVDRLFEGIRKIRNSELAVLVIEQNVQMVLNMADHGFVIENGTIAMRGTGRELLHNPQLRASYLGI
ncbi:MAG: ABC transporter ATP-binding protein [Hydrogenophaga sp.]|uniref:ABC transporter ATP-binding protein n=1 Tax=Hydrogenophaga sp. TaxID=1904254 RepID=UPI0025C25F77|nr:ABC transporter ATP-binding protein [Hydrogenophaga sp.]MBU7576000.1 ABC transporter ATP-binding protein [Hydrogenophaga sp.]